MKIPNELTTVTPLSKTLAFIVFLTLPFIAFSAGRYYERESASLQQPRSTVNQKPLPYKEKFAAQCSKTGESDKSEFLNTYTVKKGDTLLTIAQDELKNVSRVNELVEFNKDRYQELSVANPFLEQGWKLYLPPSYISSSYGKLQQVSGDLYEIRNDGYWRIGGEWGGVYKIDGNTKLFDKDTFQAGDCVSLVYETYESPPHSGNYSVKVYSVSLSHASSQISAAPSNEQVIVDFQSCTPSKSRINVAFGSTTYEIKGVIENAKGDFCLLNYGGEVENPSWDGKLDHECLIPTTSGQMTFKKTNYGVNFSSIQKFCT